MSVSVEEYRELLSFFAANTSAPHIVSLATAQSGNGSQTDSALITLSNAYGDDFNVSVAADGGENRSTAATVVPRISSEMPIWLIPCYSVIFFFAIVGNLLVISTLVQNRRMRTITNVFLLNLAISDMLLGVLCMPVTLVGTLLRHFIFGEFLCKLIQFSQAASVAVSSWTLVAISCERYYAICHPLRSRTWQTINHAYRIIGFIWFGSMMCMTPIAVFSQLMPTSRQGLRKCREHWPADTIAYERSYNIFLDLVLLVLPLLVLCVAYILITRTLYVGMRNERAMIFGGSASGCGKLNTQVEAVATVTTTLMPPSAFNVNMSFRCHKRNGGSTGGGGGGANAAVAMESRSVGALGRNAEANNVDIQSDMETAYQQQQQQQSAAHCYDEHSAHADGKSKMLMPSDGRRHLYCVRSASFRSLQPHGNDDSHNSNTNNSNNTSPTVAMTVLHAPQQQRFKLRQHQHHHLHQQQQQQQRQHQQQHLLAQHQHADRRKSNSTPSLRITEAALRRSNETKNLESKRRVVKMLFVLVLEFFICWTPLYVINTLAMFIGAALYEYIDYTSISFLQLLAYSSSCCNPITYCFMNAGFRRAFLDTFRGLHVRGGRFWHKRAKNGTHLAMAGNSMAMANSATIVSNNTMLDSPRM